MGNYERRTIDGEEWIKVPKCTECAEIHDTYPFARFYHSPLCSKRLYCADCGVPFGSSSDGIVGEVCAGCAYGGSDVSAGDGCVAPSDGGAG